jgi:RNA polymerase sigma factor (sigma-70 family)
MRLLPEMTMDNTQIEAFRPALTGHCYCMLGSVFDSDDAVQETMIRAWRSFDTFDGRASLKTWLYRIATNVCLDELKHRGRRDACRRRDGFLRGRFSRGSLAAIEGILD